MALASRNKILAEELPTNLDFRSPSVGILAQRILGPGKCQVLDLGAPAKSNVTFFFGGPCKFYLEDLYRFFIAPREDAHDQKRRLRRAFGAKLWDLAARNMLLVRGYSNSIFVASGATVMWPRSMNIRVRA